MGHDLFFHEFLRLGWLWLGMFLYWLWSQGRAATCQASLTPGKPIKTRSKAPNPFPGLRHQPSCEACEHAAASCLQALSAPPPRLVSRRGRRREVDPASHCCPNLPCSDQGWVGWGNLRANGHPGGGPWRPFYGLGCQGYFQETYGTPLHGKRISPERLV
jgi:hypothetical protein